MAGSNRSADLADAQRSIPYGTLAATLCTSVLYITTTFIWGTMAERSTLVDYIELPAIIALPAPIVVQIGIILSSLGAGLQSLTGAPRLLQAIANDNLMPFLSPFRGSGEPRRALAFTFMICLASVSGGDLNAVTPIITMFFLICYMVCPLGLPLAALHTPSPGVR
jgi:potassium/chloride transporter 4/5/6